MPHAQDKHASAGSRAVLEGAPGLPPEVPRLLPRARVPKKQAARSQRLDEQMQLHAASLVDLQRTLPSSENVAAAANMGSSIALTEAEIRDVFAPSALSASAAATATSTGRPGSSARSQPPAPAVPNKVSEKRVAVALNKAVDPKVYTPYVVARNQTPRRIEIERKKRSYTAADISKAVDASNLDIEDTQHSLPLHYFDNYDYDERTPIEWLNMTANPAHLAALAKSLEQQPSRDPTGDELRQPQQQSPTVHNANPPVPCKVYCYPLPAAPDQPVRNGTGGWLEGWMVAYSSGRQEWTVRLIKPATIAGNEVSNVAVHRHHLLFHAENPERFLKRLQAACELRETLESALKASLYIDMMPAPQMPPTVQRCRLASCQAIATRAIMRSPALQKLLHLTASPTVTNPGSLKQWYAAFDAHFKQYGNQAGQVKLAQILLSLLQEVEFDFIRCSNRIRFVNELSNVERQGQYKFLNISNGALQMLRGGDGCASTTTDTITTATAAAKERRVQRSLPTLREQERELRMQNPPSRTAGSVESIDQSFESVRKSFSFKSHLTKAPVLKTYVSVYNECTKLRSMSLFAAGVAKTVRVDEFETMQNQSMQMVKQFCKETWTTSLKNIIKLGLKDTGKGWYSLNTTNMEVYNMSQLKKFMTMVKFLMQDSVRFLIMNSFCEYERLFEQYVRSHKCLVYGTNKVMFVPISASGPAMQAAPASALKKPLFHVDLVFRNGKVMYDTDWKVFEAGALSVFDKALSTTENLPDLEPSVMDQLFWATKPVLASVHTSEPFVSACRQRICEAFKAAVVPLQSYLDLFQPHSELLNLDINKFISDYEAQNKSVQDIEEDLQRYQAQWETLDCELPTNVNLGMFHVNCESLRGPLRKDLSRAILDMLARRSSKKAQAISAAFQQVQAKLKERPLKAEELADMREFMKTIPELLKVQQVKIVEMMRDFEFLERYRYELANDDFKARWGAFAWPMQVERLVKQTEEAFVQDEQTFMRNLITDQELFKEKTHHLAAVIADFSRHTDVNRMAEILVEVQRVTMELKDCQTTSQLFNSRERLFGMPVTNYDDVANLLKDFEPYKQLWTTASDWIKWKSSWFTCPFTELNAEDIEKNITNAWRILFKLVKTFRNTPGCATIANQVKEEMDGFKPYLPLIQALRNPGMRDRHWDKLSAEFNIRLNPTAEDFTLKSLIGLNLLDKLDIITKICDEAGKEYTIEATLNKMENEWRQVVLDILPYRETGTFILKPSDEMTRLLDDHIVLTQSMNFSPFKKPFAERITLWDGKLRVMQEVLEEWMTCQRTWMYLEPIFSSEDIARQLPAESKRFSTVDRSWRRIMQQAKSKPGVVETCADSKLLDTFRESNKSLEIVSKGLSAYLESKRVAFPRFFFLSDDELLQILSQTRDPTAVQPHLRKCFENMTKLEFQPDKLITAMYSSDGECIPLSEAFHPTGNVEDWLLRVENAMKLSLREAMRRGLADYQQKARTQWVLDHPGQVVIAASQTYFTKEVTDAILNRALDQMLKQQLKQLDGLVTLVRGDLSPIARMSLGALIVIDVHAREVVRQLIDAQVVSDNDFEWMSQLRYYWEDDDLRIKIVNANFRYGYEYLGNNGRLVITPLTDRCYLTLTGAMHLGMGGAPAGPAGTGKTETTKDLAKALAKQCVVFNCSDQLDYLAMAKFFKGLAASGAWACFDEFNRIDIEVLSVIAQQITTIQKSVAAGMTRFVFEGVELGLDPTNAIFITMNPGYAGRTELPDNLKALFRPVAMMIPDYGMIAEISLFSFGFSEARLLAQKMVATFKLSSEQLSSQDHYDFGMRAVKTVISAAGNLKREQPTAPEDLLLLRALCDVNVPKFLAEDVPLFNGIISDLFPGTQQPKVDYGNLQETLCLISKKLKLQPEESFLKKCVQMYETTVVRHGMMLVGPTGGGKTSCYRVLSQALTALQGSIAPSGAAFEKVHVNVLNPKSITMGQLYGEFDAQTHEWSDGILSSMVRDGADDTTPDKKWYIFDGPVDAIWIESMKYTVLDDNKKLCLTSGEIIKLNPTQTLIFEVENLAHASPATVSRCGMVYMEPGALGLRPLVQSWFEQHHTFLPAQFHTAFESSLMPLFEALLYPALEFVRSNIREPVPTTNGSLTHSLFHLFDSALLVFSRASGLDSELVQEVVEALPPLLEPVFLFSLIWSVGATADHDNRVKFSTWLRGQLSLRPPAFLIPTEGIVHDYRFDLTQKRWVNWMSEQPPFQVDLKHSRSEIIVPTMDTVRHSFVLHQLLNGGYNVLCTGPTGTAKSVTVSRKLLNDLGDGFSPIFINFSARTSANQTQDYLDSKMEKRRKGVFGPPVGKKFVVFVDDLNMPQMESTGAQPPIELLRQWMDHRGWYDRKAIGKFMELVDIMFVSAMGPPGGGRNPITQRFLRHFNLISFVEMDDPSLSRIFGTILGAFSGQLSNDIQLLCDPIVECSIAIFRTIRAELLPTPAKSHYTYNLRDLAKVFQGVLGADVKGLNSPFDMVRLWVHESLRVFHDRLVDNTDRAWFVDLMRNTVKQKTNMSWSDVVLAEPVIYGDFLTPGADPRNYVEVKDLKKLVKLTEEYLDDYNSQVAKPMKLVMFLDAIEHVSRICRIIRQPRGHALLLGVGGSGRQSLSRLATFMSEFECFQIEISKSYGQNEWREDLKKVMFRAGLDMRSVVFLFCDTQVFSETCVEDVNNILNSGDVPNLYNAEDMDRINTVMRPVTIDAGMQPTKENMFSMYVKRVRDNLHLVFCMSPVGDAFRNRLRMFPSLVNCCTIDWFSMWPEEALRSVAANSIAEMSDLGSEVIVDGIVSLCVVMHESVRDKCVQYKAELGRNNYITPTSYLELLGLYKKLLGKKREELQALRKRTATGLEKLLNATKEVEILQEELEAMQPMLLQTSQETEYTMKRIAADKIKSEEIREIVVKEETAASKKAEETKAIADDAQRDLDEALPALAAALESLNSLSKNDVIEIRSMQRPPEGVKLVIEAVCIMKQLKPKKIDGDKPGKKVDDYWEVGKALLSDPAKFLDSLMTYDKDNIPESVIQKIKPYIDNPDFAVSVISKVSKAATSICAWARAMEKYYWVSRSIEPKRERLREAQESLEVTLRTVGELRQKLREAEININEMEKKYLESVAKKEELGRKVDECNTKLSRAGKLISGLGSERVRWAASVEDFDKRITCIVGDVLLASGTIAYLGPFTSEYRASLIREWTACLAKLKIPHSSSISLTEVLGDPAKIREWELSGLPKDNLSRDNAIIGSNSRRWPLYVDPQGQANKWIRNMEKNNGLDIVKLTDRDYLRTLENSIRFGKPCLIENVQEKLDPALEPVLLRQTFKQSGNIVIRLGDNILPYHEDFRLYLTTKLPNPHYSPETSAIVTLLNFTLAASGLEDQLLALVVANERPDLEEAKNQLTISNTQMKRELQDIEDKILYLLSSVQGSPVDDERLIETLAASKKTSAVILTKVAEAEKTEKDIDATRARYVPVAVRTRILFFCITELTNIDPMYQYSLNWFMNIFASALVNSEKAEVLEDRLLNINDYFTFSLYSNVCRSLFEKHKLLFSFLLTSRILMNDERIQMDEWRFLLTGGVAGDIMLSNPAPEWLSQKSWTDIACLTQLPAFRGLMEDVCSAPNQFKVIFDSPNPHREVLPEKWQERLDQFQRLLLLRCLRPDRVVAGVQDFVGASLGDKFIEPQTSEFLALYKESAPWVPLIFVLSPGADPASNLYKFAEEMRFSKKLTSVSLGQGQGPRAEALLRDGMEKGLWVLLQNCHLAPSWMPMLDKLVDAITPDKVHRDFRLWLTSMPTPKFPVSILQNGVKMTVEPPNGVKANLLRTYATFNEDTLAECTKPKEWQRLLFALCFFHAIIQERRKFGPLGWNIPYEFTDGDLRICVRQLKMFLEEYSDIPFKVLKYTVGHINYGGRVTDDWDRRLIMSILADYYNPKALEDNYRFSQSDIYCSPVVSGYNGYRDYIKGLPLNEPTEIFAMHDNANITFAQKETFTLFETLLTLMPKTTSSSGGKTREQVLADTCLAIVEKVPKVFNVEAIMKKYPISYKESMSTVLVQEVVRYNRVLALVNQSLQDLIRALRGFVVMSTQLEAMANSMYINQVPALWAAKAYPSLKPLSSWVSDLAARIDFLQKWYDSGIPNVFWISGFFFPQAFLTGTLQNFARKYGLPIDTLAFNFSVVDERPENIQSKPADGCYIRGLFIEGARWDPTTKSLEESRPKELYTEMAVLWLLPEQHRKKPTTGIYDCPTYKTLTRAGTLSTTGHSTNYILAIELPSAYPQDHWVKRGVALISSGNW
ncbi:hypothetical protein RI367_007902 [Sorochytrium milnesiophthora]